ncbi:MAG: type II secretion system protein [Planctomycetota bacterium]
MKLPQRNAAGFTLVELLVVISIIMVIAGFGITKVLSMRKEANLAASKERLGQIYFQMNIYEGKKKRMPTASGSDFLLQIWGRPFLAKSVNNSAIFFCESLARPPVSDETIDEDVTGGTIHWAGRNQAEKRYKVGRISSTGASKKIIACNKPLVDGEMPHAGDYLAVLYLNGAVSEIGRDDYPDDWDQEGVLEIGENSPIEALIPLIGSPEDDDQY